MERGNVWMQGVKVGLIAAVAGIVVLLLMGMIGGRGAAILEDVGGATIPRLVQTVTHASSAVSYLIVHVVLYLVAGIAALTLVRAADRAPQLATLIVFVVLIVELGFVMLTRANEALGHIDGATWRALIVSHVAADLVFAFAVVKVHPSVRRAFVSGYEGTGE